MCETFTYVTMCWDEILAACWGLSHLTETLQHTATHCKTLQHAATLCNTLQHTATHYNTLQHAANRCNTLQYICSAGWGLSYGTEIWCIDKCVMAREWMRLVARVCVRKCV